MIAALIGLLMVKMGVKLITGVFLENIIVTGVYRCNCKDLLLAIEIKKSVCESLHYLSTNAC